MSEPALPSVNVKAIARVALGFVALAAIAVVVLTFGPLRDRKAAPSIPGAQAVAPATAGRDSSGDSAVNAPISRPDAGHQDLTGQAPAAQAPSAPAPAGEPALQVVTPGFDVVRMEPNGESVIAGRAAPNVAIELLLHDGKGGPPQVLQRGVTDSGGMFAFTHGPLPAGSHVLSLRAGRGPDHWTVSQQTVNVTLSPPAPPLVALVAPDRPAVILSSPQPQPVPVDKAASAPRSTPQAGSHAAGTAAAGSGARVAQVDTDSSGRLFIVGKARPGATLRLYLNDALLASGVARSDGIVDFALESRLPGGDYRIRLDEVDPATGKVLSRAEAPWDNKPAGLAAGAGAARPGKSRHDARGADATRQPSGNVVKTGPIRTHVVSPGESLWSISRNTYQLGSRYTTIYDANQNQIADADRIYPGQVFVLPSGDPGRTSEK